jgi:hypothetical protein
LCLRHNVFTLFVLTAGIVSYCLFALKDMFFHLRPYIDIGEWVLILFLKTTKKS